MASASKQNKPNSSRNEPNLMRKEPNLSRKEPNLSRKEPNPSRNEPNPSRNEPSPSRNEPIDSVDEWRDFVTSLYPEATTKAYCVPPLHFNRVPYHWKTVPGLGEPVLVLQMPENAGTSTGQASGGSSQASTSTSAAARATSSSLTPPRVLWTHEEKPEKQMKQVNSSDFLDDFAQAHVAANLKKLSERLKEPMFMLFQMRFGNYLRLTEHASLPKPKDLDTPGIPYSRGEADVIVIHRYYGVLIAETKAVGRWKAVEENCEAPDKDVVKRIQKAVKQLNKSEKVIRYVVSDVAPTMTVRKTLFLPYVTSVQLQRIIETNKQLQKDVLQCLGAADVSEAVQLCVCADQLSDPDTFWEVTEDILQNLVAWWSHTMKTRDPLLSEDRGENLYLDIVARFVGPATTVSVHCCVPPRVEVQVRTRGQAAAELGRRLSRLVLTPQQLDILTKDAPLVRLTGPPGSGKTVVLVLQGVRWLRQGHDVHILSTWAATFATSCLIQSQLQVTVASDATDDVNTTSDVTADANTNASGADCKPGSSPPGKVHVHHYDCFNDNTQVDNAVTDLTKGLSDGGSLHVLMDEAVFYDGIPVGPRNSLLVEKLQSCCRAKQAQLFLWCACIITEQTQSPDGMLVEQLSSPLRSAPTVLREVRPALQKFKDVRDYAPDGSLLPAPADGLPVIHIRHEGEGHQPDQWAGTCETCGRDVAGRLGELGVGSSKDSPLAWRDVLVVTRSAQLQDDVRGDDGAVTSPACGFVRGLRDADVPVCVFDNSKYDTDRVGWQRMVASVATAERNEVTVARLSLVHGLERRVVVWLVGKESSLDMNYTDEEVEARDRLYIVTRCISQLIIVGTPPSEYRTKQVEASENCEKKLTAALRWKYPK